MRAARFLLVILAASLLGACANYSLGPTGALSFHTLYVATVQNKTYVPQAQAPVTEFLRQSLLQEGNLKLSDQEAADATLDVVLTDYRRSVAATAQSNTLNARSYTLTLVASCTLVNNHNGKVYFKDRIVSTSTEAYISQGNDFSEPEYQSIPLLARELGRKIKDTVVGTW
jgi:hypothetical protein